jgi:puromycin-sensitive aminopeptidase
MKYYALWWVPLRYVSYPSTTHQQIIVFSAGLASFASKPLLTKALTFSLSEHVRAQDSGRIIGAVARNPLGRDLAWEFFKENFAFLKERFVNIIA